MVVVLFPNIASISFGGNKTSLCSNFKCFCFKSCVLETNFLSSIYFVQTNSTQNLPGLSYLPLYKVDKEIDDLLVLVFLHHYLVLEGLLSQVDYYSPNFFSMDVLHLGISYDQHIRLYLLHGIKEYLHCKSDKFITFSAPT